MENIEESYVTIPLNVKATVRVRYRDEQDITNNLHELVEDSIEVVSHSDQLIIQDTEVKGEIEWKN